MPKRAKIIIKNQTSFPLLPTLEGSKVLNCKAVRGKFEGGPPTSVPGNSEDSSFVMTEDSGSGIEGWIVYELEEQKIIVGIEWKDHEFWLRIDHLTGATRDMEPLLVLLHDPTDKALSAEEASASDDIVATYLVRLKGEHVPAVDDDKGPPLDPPRSGAASPNSGIKVVLTSSDDESGFFEGYKVGGKVAGYPEYKTLLKEKKMRATSAMFPEDNPYAKSNYKFYPQARVRKAPMEAAELFHIWELPEKGGASSKKELANLRTTEIENLLPKLNDAFRIMEMDTVGAMGALVANALVESDGFSYMTETAGSCKPEHDPPYRPGQQDAKINADWLTKAADGTLPVVKGKKNSGVNQQVYAGLNPTKDPTWKMSFIGRGAIQVTGRMNYLQCLAAMKVRLERGGFAVASDEGLLAAAFEAIKKDPSQASSYDYTFLFTAAFMKRWFANQHGEWSQVDYLPSTSQSRSPYSFMGEPFDEVTKTRKKGAFDRALKRLGEKAEPA